MTDSEDWAAGRLRELEAAGLKRSETVQAGASGPEVTSGRGTLISFCSNDYLALAGDVRVARAAASAAHRFGAGAGASRLVSGTMQVHKALEAGLAALAGCDDAVVFSSGYLANLGAICSLVHQGDVVFSDRLNHASIVDACRLSRARVHIFEHRDLGQLEALLASEPAPRRLVVTESIFSMDGDLAPLPALIDMCRRYHAMLMVDEAHAIGVLGPRGGGALEAAGLSGRADIVMGTLSKALGSSGGFVAGKRPLMEWIRNRARTYMFDTALGPPSAGAALTALEIARGEPALRQRATANAQRFARGLRKLGFDVPDPPAAVFSVVLGEPSRAVSFSRRLAEAGILIPAIRPPSVPEGTSRLRITTMAAHTGAHIERALEAISLARDDRQAATRAPGRQAVKRESSGPGPLHHLIDKAGGVFVTGTDTGVGKTVVSSLLAASLRAARGAAAYLKPVQTGTSEGDDDAARVRTRSGLPPELVRCSVALPEPLAPSVAAAVAGRTVEPAFIADQFDELRSLAGLVIVEGAGGIAVPVTAAWTMGDLAAFLGLPVIVVCRPGLGTLNHTGLTVQFARARGLSVLGFVLNGFPPRPGLAERTNPAELERVCGAPLLGVVPLATGEPNLTGDPLPFLGPELGGSFSREAFLKAIARPGGPGGPPPPHAASGQTTGASIAELASPASC